MDHVMTTGDAANPDTELMTLEVIERRLKAEEKEGDTLLSANAALLNDLNVEVRFDVIGIIKNEKETKTEHFKDAFFHF